MSRNCSAGYKARLAGQNLPLAICVLLTLRDGTKFGFTSHSRSLTVSGQTYDPSDGVTLTAIEMNATGQVDNSQMVGLLTSTHIKESDIRAGRFDGATFTVFECFWDDLSLGTMTLQTGVIGRIDTKEGTFTAESRSLLDRATQHIGKQTQPLCRVARLGNTECGVNVSTTPFRVTGSITVVTSRLIMTVGARAEATDFFSYGEIQFTSGANSGYRREIKSHILNLGTAVLTLAEPTPFDVAVSDTVVLIAGCDRRITTCNSRFNNAVNFRGEPDIPGQDSLRQVGRPNG